MLLIICITCVVLLCVATYAYRSVLNQVARNVWLPLWIFSLLLVDIFKDFYTDFWKNKDEPVALPGEVAVITGGARGIGVEVIKKLMKSHLSVIIGCRNVADGERLLAYIRQSGVSTGDLTSYNLDLNSLASVKKFAEVVLQNHKQIHILVNNAGITAPARELTEDGVERTFAVNYLSHCYLTHLLLPRLAESGRTRGSHTRVVNVSSCVHKYPVLGHLHLQDLTRRDNYQQYSAYGQSKVAQVMFTKTLDAKLRSTGVPVQVHSVHPGVVHTNMMTQNIFHWAFPWVYPLILRTPEEGARSVYYACTSAQLDARGGTYIESCEVVPSGGVSTSEPAQKQLWNSTMKLLHLESFGGMFD